jgi:hypothetical protein
MAWPSNWLKVRSTCADVNFIAHSFVIRFATIALAPRLKQRAKRDLAPSHLKVVNIDPMLVVPAQSHMPFFVIFAA